MGLKVAAHMAGHRQVLYRVDEVTQREERLRQGGLPPAGGQILQPTLDIQASSCGDGQKEDRGMNVSELLQ